MPRSRPRLHRGPSADGSRCRGQEAGAPLAGRPLHRSGTLSRWRYYGSCRRVARSPQAIDNDQATESPRLFRLPTARSALVAGKALRILKRRINGLWIISISATFPASMSALFTGRDCDARQVPPRMVPSMLSGGSLGQAFQAVRDAIRSFQETLLTQSLIELLPTSEKDRESEVDALMQSIPRLPDPTWRRRAYTALVERIPKERLPELRRRLSRIEDEPVVLGAVARLAAAGDEALRQVVFNRVNALPPSPAKLSALVALARPVEDSHHASVIEAVSRIADELTDWSRTSVDVERVMPLLNERTRARLLERAATSLLESGSEKEFVRLASHLPAACAIVMPTLLRASTIRHQQESWVGGGRRS